MRHPSHVPLPFFLPLSAFHDGWALFSFYFGLPLAMLYLHCFVPPYTIKLKVIIPLIEFLESRFDVKTRTLAAILFLIQRGISWQGSPFTAPSINLSQF